MSLYGDGMNSLLAGQCRGMMDQQQSLANTSVLGRLGRFSSQQLTGFRSPVEVTNKELSVKEELQRDTDEWLEDIKF